MANQKQKNDIYTHSQINKFINRISCPQLQTKYGKKGNCLSACITTLFKIPIDEVPIFADKEEIWVSEMSVWFNTQFNKFAMPVKLITLNDVFIFNGSLMIVSINSDDPHINRHAVIAVDGVIIFDPKYGIIEKPITTDVDATYILIGNVISSC